jgi:hypothetical protein
MATEEKILEPVGPWAGGQWPVAAFRSDISQLFERALLQSFHLALAGAG